jgi:hypothetical protein
VNLTNAVCGVSWYSKFSEDLFISVVETFIREKETKLARDKNMDVSVGGRGDHMATCTKSIGGQFFEATHTHHHHSLPPTSPPHEIVSINLTPPKWFGVT